jgi:hypothetical protein
MADFTDAELQEIDRLSKADATVDPTVTASIPAESPSFLDTIKDKVSGVFNTVAQKTVVAGIVTNAANQTPDQFIDTLSKANPDFTNLGEVLKTNPALKIAFQDAFIKSDEFRNSLINGGNEPGALSIDNITQILTDEQHGSQAQTLMTKMLDKVAKGEMSYAQVEQVSRSGVAMIQVMNKEGATAEEKAKAQQDFMLALEKNGLPTGQIKSEQLMEYLREVMTGDPEQASKNLIKSLGLEGEQAAALEEMLTMMSGILKYVGAPYYEFAQKWGPTLGTQVAGLADRATGAADARIAEEHAKETPAQRAQREMSEAANEPGAMQNAATGNEKILDLGGKKIISNIYVDNASGERQDGYKDPAKEQEIHYVSPTRGVSANFGMGPN